MRQRFLAPARENVDRAVFASPIFAALAPYGSWFTTPEWPDLATLNRGLGERSHEHSGARLQFARQDADCLADGLHYESRIHDSGAIATRSENWHDLFNAAIWCRYFQLKCALNRRQHEDVQRSGSQQRTRAQAAMTQFDEAGVVLLLDRAADVAAYDRHDWSTWFQQGFWTEGWRVLVFGHALLEHALKPHALLTGKALLIQGVGAETADAAVDGLANAIAVGALLNDPQELRPLPISGIPGWSADQDAEFYRRAPCFMPLREGRNYPAPWLYSAPDPTLDV